MHPILALQHLELDANAAPGIETNMGSSYSGTGCLAGLADTGDA